MYTLKVDTTNTNAAGYNRKKGRPVGSKDKTKKLKVLCIEDEIEVPEFYKRKYSLEDISNKEWMKREKMDEDIVSWIAIVVFVVILILIIHPIVMEM